jgi:hypothetical protein
MAQGGQRCQNAGRLHYRRHSRSLSAAIHRLAAALVVVAVSVYPGMDLLAETKSRAPFTSSIKNFDMSPQELRIRVRALIRPTLGIIEERADRIMVEASDPLVRRGVLVLKIEMSATLLAAMLRSDPVLAFGDAWGYVLQVEDLLKRPEMRAKYSLSGQMDSEAFALIEGQFRDLAASVSGTFAESLSSAVRQWADRHPIEGSIYRRPSMDSAVAKKLASPGDSGVFAAIGGLEETMADVMTRMDLYTMYLPRLARWEAELAADDLTRGVDAKTLNAEFERITRAADRIATVTETVSDLAARERKAVMDAIRAERRAVMDEVRKERIAVLQEAEAMSKRLMVDAGERLEQVVDHAFYRLMQLLLACAALAVLVLALRYYFLHRREKT